VITEHDLREAIAECEGQRNPTASTCMKLAAFYTIKDKMFPDRKEQEPFPLYSAAAAPASILESEPGGSEFMQAVAGMDARGLVPIMDELMSTLKVVSPRIYAGVMRRLSELN